MTRDEALHFVGKYVKVYIIDFGEVFGYFALSKNSNRFVVYCIVKNDTLDKKEVLKTLDSRRKTDVNEIKEITEIKITEIKNCVSTITTLHEYFGHEIGDWLSKPIELSIDLNKYPHVCRKCNSPSWNNPVTGHSDCSNKNCK